MLDVGVDNQNRNCRVGQRNHFRLAGTAVEQHRVIFLTEVGNELVHNPAGHMSELVFRLLAQQAFLNRIHRLAGNRFAKRGNGNFQSRRGRQPAAKRDV